MDPEIEEQLAFVEWLRERGIYNYFATAQTMRFGKAVWEAANRDTLSLLQQIACLKAALQTYAQEDERKASRGGARGVCYGIAQSALDQCDKISLSRPPVQEQS